MSQPPPTLPIHNAFVVQFRSQPPEAPLVWAGRVEHLVSGHVGRFHAAAELLAFLARELTAVQHASNAQPLSSAFVAVSSARRLSSTHPQPAGPAAVWRCWLLGACRWRGGLRQPGWWPPEPARHWYAGRLGGARCGETLALGSREKWLSFSYPRPDLQL